MAMNIRCKNASSLASWCNKLPVCYGVRDHDITVLTEPYQMYKVLVALINTSKSRINLSALYLGNGDLESALVSQVNMALERNPKLQVDMLFDFCRGLRGEKNSQTLLQKCLQNHPHRMRLFLFHTPNLRGLLKSFLPSRLNELLGLMHMKAYVFDDTLVLSGANLSQDYFMNRQDRCIIIRNSPGLCDFYCGLAQTVSSVAYVANDDGTVSLHEGCKGEPNKESQAQEFIDYSEKKLKTYLDSRRNLGSNVMNDTKVYPLAQMGSFHIDQERRAMINLFGSETLAGRFYLATAYFNPLRQYIQQIGQQLSCEYHLLTASPEANGFFNAKGMLRYIPRAYSWYELSFLKYVIAKSQRQRVQLFEYRRDHWTFHVKGLWFYPKAQSLPNMTVIGSSNYGYRSVFLDLEVQSIISTSSELLQAQFQREKDNIYKRSQEITDDKITEISSSLPFWVGFLTNLCRKYF